MKKILIMTLAALMALAAFAGCTSSRPQEGAVPTNPASGDFSREDLDLHLATDGLSIGAKPTASGEKMYRPDFTEVVRLNRGGAEAGAYYVVYTDYDKLIAEVGELTGKTERDITRDTLATDFVVAVFVTVPTGGHKLSVSFAENDGHTVKVSIKDEGPEAGAAVTQAFETHCVLVGFDRGDFYDDLAFEINLNGAAVKANGEEA